MPQLVSETPNRKNPNGITQSTGVREEEGKIGTKREKKGERRENSKAREKQRKYRVFNCN